MNPIVAWISLGCVLLVAIHCKADERHEKAVADSPVVARVGSQSITVADIDFLLGRTPIIGDDRLPSKESRSPLTHSVMANAIQLMAGQRQALATLQSTGQASPASAIDAAILAGAPPAQSDWTVEEIVDDVCQRYGIEPAKYRDFIDFRLSWPRYLAAHLTEENLSRHFENQRARFDGTRFQIDLISIDAPTGRSPNRDETSRHLEKLRNLLLANPNEWEQYRQRALDQRHQAVALARWVNGSGDLPSELITPLLEFDVGQISPPIQTATGVHVIRLRERESGKLNLDQVRGDVRAHMLLVLFEYLAEQSQRQLPLVAELQMHSTQ